MKRIVFILILFPIFLLSQTAEKETVYVLFDTNSDEKCKIDVEQTYSKKQGIEFVKKFRKKAKKDRFYICDEIFRLHRKGAIDTCNTDILKKITFKDMNYLNAKRDELKPVNFFKNSVFGKIYFIEPYKDYVVKYEVIWATDLIQN